MEGEEAGLCLKSASDCAVFVHLGFLEYTVSSVGGFAAMPRPISISTECLKDIIKIISYLCSVYPL